MAMNPRLLRPKATGFNPKHIAGLQLWLDAADQSTLFDADTGGSIVTADAAVGRWMDKSGNGRNFTQDTANNRPLYRAAGRNGRGTLEFDGSNDLLLGDATQYFKSNAPFTAIFVHFVATDAASFPTLMVSKTDLTQNFVMFESSFAGYTDYSIGTNSGTARTRYTTAARNAWRYILFDFVGSNPTTDASYSGRAGGANLTRSTASAFAGNTTAVSSISSAANPMKGQLSEVLVYSKVLSALERDAVEGYLAWKWGITLAPQVANAEAQDWISRVYAAGSTVSQPVANAVSDFITGCQADGIWDAMNNVVLLAGADTLTGALVPVKGVAPTSQNFVGGDYSATSGLKGDGTTKRLDSNYLDDTDPQNDCHVSVFVSEASTAAAGNLQTYLAGGNGSSFRGISESWGFAGVFAIRANARISNPVTLGDNGLTGLMGLSRSASGFDFDGYRSNAGVTLTIAQNSAAPGANTIGVFDTKVGASFVSPERCTNARISLYTLGAAIDLSALDARVSALMTAIGVI